MKIKDTIIVILSSGRAGKVITNELFPKNIIRSVVIVPEEQLNDYSKYHSNLLSLPPDVPRRIASTRQWALEYFKDEYKYIWMMDDDLVYLTRNADNKLVKSKRSDIKSMFFLMREQVDKYKFVGISTRLGNNRVEEDFKDVTRSTQSYCMCSETILKNNITFAPYPELIGEEFHVILSLLNLGFANRVIFKYSQADRGGSNASGGCSVYRNNEVQKKAAYWLSNAHPEVTVKAKASKAWKDMDGKGADNYRVDFNIGWKSAFKEVKKRRSGGFNNLFKKHKNKG